jgi:hypothetical protein
MWYSLCRGSALSDDSGVGGEGVAPSRDDPTLRLPGVGGTGASSSLSDKEFRLPLRGGVDCNTRSSFRFRPDAEVVCVHARYEVSICT